MHEISDVVVAAIIAAFIAGLVSLIGLIISKEQKTSEFRQAWIDALRSELSSLISYANNIHRGLGSHKPWEDMKSDFLGINMAAANIRLRLNPDEDAPKKVLEKINEFERLLDPAKQHVDYNALNKTEKELVDASHIILKNAWVHVKKGEKIYRVTCFVLWLALGGGIVFSMFCFFGIDTSLNNLG